MPKSTLLNVLLWVDNENQYDVQGVISRMGRIECIEYYYAMHDLDTKEDGSLRDPHYHAVFKFKSAKECRVLAKDLGIPEQLVECSKGTFKDAVQYLIHKNETDPHKYHYDKSIIHGSNSPNKYFTEESDQKGMLLMDAIYSREVHSIKELYEYAKSISAWSEFRRGFVMYNTVLNQCNREIWSEEEMHERALRKQEERVLAKFAKEFKWIDNQERISI